VNHLLRSIVLPFLATSLVGLSSPARADVSVVTTVPTLAAIAREVGGKRVRVQSLSLPTQDPHFVDARPSLVLQLNKASLLVSVGLDLEVGWLPTLQTGARNPEIQRGATGHLDCSTYAPILDVPRAKVDRSMGDIHPGGNPHYLYDPRGAGGCASGIAARLATIDPAHAGEYRANVKAFEAKLATRQAAWKKALAPYRGKSIVTYHRSWTYLLDWVGLRSAGELEPKPGIPPTPRHVARVIQSARQAGARVVLQEGFYPDRTGKLVADKIGATVVAPPGGPDVRAGQSYFEYMDALVAQLVRALAR
jgi:zinc/manganese transport system substrate-binding protein